MQAEQPATTASAPETTAGGSPLVVFSLDGLRYALPLGRVRRSLRALAVTPLPQAPPIVLGILDLGGLAVPVIDIRRRFNRPPRAMRLSDHLIIAETGRRTVALLVDETTGVIPAAPERLVHAAEILPHLELVEGALLLEDGLILIHDLDRLLSLEEEEAIDAALRAAGGGGDPHDGGAGG